MSAEVKSHGSSIQWRSDFHWMLCVSTLIQSGVDIASDGLTPLLNRGGAAQRFQSLQHFSESFGRRCRTIGTVLNTFREDSLTGTKHSLHPMEK